MIDRRGYNLYTTKESNKNKYNNFGLDMQENENKYLSNKIKQIKQVEIAQQSIKVLR